VTHKEARFQFGNKEAKPVQKIEQRCKLRAYVFLQNVRPLIKSPYKIETSLQWKFGNQDD